MLAGQPAAYATPYSYYPAAVNPWQVRYQPCPPPGYDESPGLKPLDREQGKTHLVRKFDHVEESLSFYMHTLNSHPAYHKLRQIRQQLRREQQPVDGHTLADGLEEYSAIGEQYIHTIQTIIRQNDWGQSEYHCAGGLTKIEVRWQELKVAVTELRVNGGQEQLFLNILIKEGRQALHYTQY